MVDEQTHMWYVLSGHYGDLAWEMLKDMVGKRFSHKKASKYLTYIMDNWPDEEVCRTAKTWAMYSDFNPLKLDKGVFDKFVDKYSVYLYAPNKLLLTQHSWPKPS